MLQLKHFFTIKYTYLSKYTNESIYLGSRIEKVVETTSWDYYEAVQRFQRIMEAQGINEALKQEGAEEGTISTLCLWSVLVSLLHFALMKYLLSYRRFGDDRWVGFQLFRAKEFVGTRVGAGECQSKETTSQIWWLGNSIMVWNTMNEKLVEVGTYLD